MDIVVCVKRVPSTDTAIKIAGDGKSIETAGVEFVLNPYDEIAVEQALKTKEQVGAGSVTVVTLGPKEAQKELRTTLAMGADKAVLLTAAGWIHDSRSTAVALANWIRTVPCDIVFCGRQAVDSDNNQLPSRLAALLGFGCVTEAAKIDLADGTFTVERDIEGAREVLTCRRPAVISCNKGLNEPRYASLKGIMAAKKKPLEEIPADLPEPALAIESLALPPARPAGRIVGNGKEAVPDLIQALRNEAKVL
ncbi:MAG: electron transfer flavoprotein subunit beta/FixA family protein [Planctomycetota bacterium]